MIEAVTTLEAAGVRVVVDGGWGVDALLGEQTREHDDLDIVAALEDIDAILAALAHWRLRIVEDQRPVRCVLGGSGDRRIDVHTVTFDAIGGGVQPQPSGGSFRYPPEGFVAGAIAGTAVRCISPEVQLLCHLGYEPGETDRHDMELLFQQFDLERPEAYHRGTS